MLRVLVLTFVFLRLLLRSPFGRALQGIRANEQRMRSLGFPVSAYKLAEFRDRRRARGTRQAICRRRKTGFVSPEILSWHQSGNVLLMVILGGVATPYGPIAGAFVLVSMEEILSVADEPLAALARRAAIVLLVLFYPAASATRSPRARWNVLA